MTNSINLDYDFLKIFVETAIKSAIFTALWFPVYAIRSILVIFIAKAKPSYGRILDHVDSTVEENYTQVPPKNSLVFTLVLDGRLELKELRRLFFNNVLGAKIRNKLTGQDEVRFPELKQYQVNFAGYRFWKNDQTFNVDNHIIEEPFNAKRFGSMSKVHQDMINLMYKEKRSPWEMTLVQNYNNNSEKTLIIFRCHHSMGDTKSCLNVLVECLGSKTLTLPEAQFKSKGLIDSISYYALLPFYFVFSQVVIHYAGLRGNDSPFKFKKEEEPLLHVGISQKISMSDVKLVGKRNNVTTSAVIMCAMAGGIAKSNKKLAEKDVPCQWVLPKPNHPETMSNHHYSGTIDLPTSELSNRDRLQRCNEIFKSLKNSNLYVYDKTVLFQNGTWFNPLRTKWLRSSVFPLILTNIASDREGFKIGETNVTDFTMTCAPLSGVTGVIICAFSYKDVIEISASVKGGILNEAQTQKLAELMAEEIQILKNL